MENLGTQGQDAPAKLASGKIAYLCKSPLPVNHLASVKLYAYTKPPPASVEI